MTTPSETRAGKLPDAIPTDEAMEIRYGVDYIDGWNSYRNHALEALAASEPVRYPPQCPKCGYTKADCQFHLDHHLCGEPEPPAEWPAASEPVSHWPCEVEAQRQVDDTVIIGATLVLDGEFFRELIVEDVMFLTPIDQQERARHLLSTKNTHPAPEQSGKGEAVQPNEVMVALRKRVSDAGTQAKFALQVKASTTYVSDVLAGKREIPEDWVFCMGYRKGGWVRCNTELMTTPQPSDPAEGDALGMFNLLLQRLRGQLADSTSDFAYVIVRDYANELGDIFNALSTPPTAAVRVDTNDILFVGFDKNMEKRLFHLRDTAERHCIGDIKTYAALDPQVKR